MIFFVRFLFSNHIHLTILQLECYFYTKNYEKAITDFSEALYYDKNLKGANAMISYAYYELGFY